MPKILQQIGGDVVEIILAERARLIDEDCGSLENVRKIVAAGKASKS